MKCNRKDDIAWVKSTYKGNEFLFFLTEPFLYPSLERSAGKLIYANCRPFQNGSLKKNKRNVIWYSTTTRLLQNKPYSLSDSEIQALSRSLGFLPATKIDGNLNSFESADIIETIWTPACEPNLLGFLSSKSVDDIESFYKLPLSKMRITGSMHAFGHDLSQASDIDLVIPINNSEVARMLATSLIPNFSKHVIEYGLKWPLRWYTDEGYIICPFFVYGNLPPLVEKVMDTGETIDCILEIEDDSYGIFNMPIYYVNTPVELLIVRPRIARGVFRKGNKYIVKAPVFEISSGSARGMSAAVVTNVHEQVIGLERDIFSGWRT